MKRNQRVRVQHWNNEEVTIVGLDNNGDLRVQRLDGNKQTLQFNSFRFDPNQQNSIIPRA